MTAVVEVAAVVAAANGGSDGGDRTRRGAVSAMGAKEVGAATTVIVADWRQWQR